MHNPNNSEGFSLNVPERMAIIETTGEDYPALANAAVMTAAAVWYYAPPHVRVQFRRCYPDAAEFFESVKESLPKVAVTKMLPADIYDDVAQDSINIACMSMLLMPPDWKQRVLSAYPILAGPLETFRKRYEQYLANEKKSNHP